MLAKNFYLFLVLIAIALALYVLDILPSIEWTPWLRNFIREFSRYIFK